MYELLSVSLSKHAMSSFRRIESIGLNDSVSLLIIIALSGPIGGESITTAKN